MNKKKIAVMDCSKMENEKKKWELDNERLQHVGNKTQIPRY